MSIKKCSLSTFRVAKGTLSIIIDVMVTNDVNAIRL